MRKIGTINDSDIIEQDDGSVTFTAGAQLDGDGANGQFGEPPCYAPASYHRRTLDVIENAGQPRQLVRGSHRYGGSPIVQTATDCKLSTMISQYFIQSIPVSITSTPARRDIGP